MERGVRNGLVGLLLASGAVLIPLNLAVSDEPSQEPKRMGERVGEAIERFIGYDAWQTYEEWKAGRLEGDIDTIMRGATRFKGQHIGSWDFPAYFETDSGLEEVKLKVRAEYVCGPRGGSGAARILFWLGEEHWHDHLGINRLRIFFLENEKSTMSKKIFEINVNRHLGVATFMPLEYRILEGDYIFDKIKGSLYTVLKKVKIDKKDVKNVLFIMDLLGGMYDYQLHQRIIGEVSREERDHVYFIEVDYRGYGFWDRKEIRDPKLVEVFISRGEGKLKVIGARYNIRRYRESDSWLIKDTRQRTNTDLWYAPLDVGAYLKTAPGYTREIKEEPEEVEEEE